MEEGPIVDRLEYLLVLDFQATCIQDSKPEPCPEIIEFPIIVVHIPSGKKLDVFHYYVKPTFNPILTKFCTELTGITQQMVDKGILITEVLQQLDKWFNSLKYLTEDNFAFVTCGDWDLRTCLRQQAKHKRLYIKKYLRNYINIKKYFAKIVPGQPNPMGMMGMLKILDLKHQGRHHSGIDDVTNICNICIQLASKYKAAYLKSQINSVSFHLPPENIKPSIKYLLVLDFQATCKQNQRIEPCQQIIEFPVIVVDTHSAKILDRFHQYVKPKFNPELSQFCTELTGITQQQVNNKNMIQQVLKDFDQWLLSIPYLEKDNFAFVTCGDWDLCSCLRLQAKTKGFKPQKYFESYINLKSYFPKLVKIKGRANGMMEMLKCLNLKHEGKHHSGIDDVKNLCNICLELIKEHDAKFPRTQVRNIQF